jgi:hypothetical protein
MPNATKRDAMVTLLATPFFNVFIIECFTIYNGTNFNKMVLAECKNVVVRYKDFIKI